MNVILGNMGNESVALMRWAYLAKLADVKVVFIDTAWMASHWPERIAMGRKLAAEYGFEWVDLQSKPGFEQMVKDRGSFPSTKFQWCAGFLKGLPILDWLDNHDVKGQATILLGLYKARSRAYSNLPEFINESEHFGERKVWYPLYAHGLAQIMDLAKAASLPILAHRSLECEPCVNNSRSDFQQMKDADIYKTKLLEQELRQSMFAHLKSGDNSIEDIVQWSRLHTDPEAQQALEQFDMGCGSSYGCGT